MWWIVFILILIKIVIKIKYIYSYWERKGFRFIIPNIPFGNLKTVVIRQRCFGLCIYDLYKLTSEPFIGIYLMFRPAILIRDPELVKKILVEDFLMFHDRGTYLNEKTDPLVSNLFNLTGAKWKLMRSKLTPTFTSGKLKAMFPIILEKGELFQNHLNVFAKRRQVIDVKDEFARFTMDVIASVFFGLEINTIDDPNHEFRKMGLKATKVTFIEGLRYAAFFMCPQILKKLRINGLNTDVSAYMIRLVKTIIEQREKQNLIRKDFMQLLLQLRNSGEIQSDENWNFDNAKIKSLTIEECAAQVFVFYIGGFETSSATMSFCLHELAQNPALMKRLQNEIDQSLKKYDNKINYECINDMRLLELCVKETFRKYPGLPILNRECSKDYQIPGTNKIIDKGTAIVISIHGIQRDEKYFPKPDTFDPDRFSDERKLKDNFKEEHYLPFGNGPRSCIGYRMGKMITKVGLVLMLRKYNFEATKYGELTFEPEPVSLIPKDGINLKITLRN